MSRVENDPVARIRHDLRGPLSVIAGFASLLAVRDDARLRLEAAEQIGLAASVLTERIDDLLDQLAPPGPARERRRVVVIDDDEHLRKLLRATFDASSLDFVEASDGTEALTLLDPPPALVVLDWHLPSSPGAEVLAALKDAHPALPVVVLTGDVREDERALADSLGADAYLTKPFSPLELLATIERLVG